MLCPRILLQYYYSGWGTTRQSQSACPCSSSFLHGNASRLPPSQPNETLQSAFFGNRSSVLFSPPNASPTKHLPSSHLFYHHLASLINPSRPILSSFNSPAVFTNTCIDGIISPLPISGQPAMVGPLNGAKTNSGFWWRTEILSDHQLVLRTVHQWVA